MKGDKEPMQMGFYCNQNRCTGCYACVIACKDWHDIPAGPASWLRLKTLHKGKYPNPRIANLPLLCYQCQEPACVTACPVGAISKRQEDGIVVVNREACLGKDNCDMCLQACTYDAPQFGAEENAKMQKCDLCLDRLMKNEKPSCVSACSTLALDVGPLDELRIKYGDIKEAEGFIYSDDLQPSVTFKPKRGLKELPVHKIVISPQTSV